MRSEEVPLTQEQQRLVEDNIKLAAYCACKFGYIVSDLDFDEVHSLCMYWLLYAARKFDPSRGYRFSTLAVLCIRRRLVVVANKKKKIKAVNFHHFDGIERTHRQFMAVDALDSAEVVLSKVHPKYAQIYRDRYLLGKDLHELGRDRGVSYQRAGQILNEARKAVNKVAMSVQKQSAVTQHQSGDQYAAETR